MTEAQPALLSAALIERDALVLAAHRKQGRRPFGGQWLLPMTVVGDRETAEEAVRRHVSAQFGVTVANEVFADTVYIEDPDDAARYVANVFRTELADGALRFNADGDYDDARWLSAEDVASVWMPPALREAVVRALTDGPIEEMPAWDEPPSDAVPLAEREAPIEPPSPPPDNAAAWDAIAAAWQDERYGDRFGTKLMWSWRASEDDLHLLDDVRGKRAIVLGCGGGQDAVALEKLGAVVTGVDASAVQIAYAKKYALRNEAPNASFLESDVTDLSRFDDASFDLAVSIGVMEYVERLDLALAEAARVLRAGGLLVLSVKHPFDVVVDGDGGPPYAVWTPYWTPHHDLNRLVEQPDAPPMRSYLRTLSQWFESLDAAGFAIERLVEPDESKLPAVADELDEEWLRLLPYALIIKARKR
jgi:ubiquinone/menaquinone biosynthesis C-methylase UbiE/ADP-ribose pyrophosphatase YjhB (NUDIX family)